MTPKPCSLYETDFSLFQASAAVISNAAKGLEHYARLLCFPLILWSNNTDI